MIFIRRSEITMKKIIILSILLASLLLTTFSLAAGPPKIGSPLADITLTAPKDSAEKDYLGWGWGKSFKIPETQAPYVLIEIFSMYCPYCQGEAPNLNKLFAKNNREVVLLKLEGGGLTKIYLKCQ